MNRILMALIRVGNVPDEDIADELYEICDSVHASCDNSCPVYEKNGGAVGADKPFKENRGCDCFKNGMAMLAFLRDVHE